MSINKWLLLLLAMALLAAAPPAGAAVDATPVLSIVSHGIPLETAATADGKWLFILTDQRQIEVHEVENGELKGLIRLAAPADHLAVSPNGERIFVTNRKDKRTTMMEVSFVEAIDTSGSPFKGPEQAPVAVVVFSDFQCPYCAKLQPLLDQILKAYPQEVKVVYKQFPLQMHPFSMSASLAAMAANRQGKFWPMHDKIFESYQSVNEAKLSGFAKELGLDMAKFDKDIADPKLKEQVLRDRQEGIAAGVRGTPTLFVNGRQVRDRSFEGLKALVDGELQRLKARVKP